MCVIDHKAGIAHKDKELAKVIGHCARHVETTLKLVGEIQMNYTNPSYVAECVDNIYITNVALIRYIQEELSSLVLSNQYGPEAKSVFRSVRRNTTFYTLGMLEDVKTTIQLTQNSIQQNLQQQNQNNRGF